MIDKVMLPCGHGQFKMHGPLAGCRGGRVVDLSEYLMGFSLPEFLGRAGNGLRIAMDKTASLDVQFSREMADKLWEMSRALGVSDD